MHDAVKLRLRADVPLGTCLSGGLDSSTIVTIINNILKKDGVNNLNQTGERQKSFSAVYDDERYDERKFIEEIVKVTNCDSHYVYPDRKDLQESDFPVKRHG
ncbi:MAG: asparagine synthase C-terminal domain-containing protein [Ignavibacteria bacterium]